MRDILGLSVTGREWRIRERARIGAAVWGLQQVGDEVRVGAILDDEHHVRQRDAADVGVKARHGAAAEVEQRRAVDGAVVVEVIFAVRLPAGKGEKTDAVDESLIVVLFAVQRQQDLTTFVITDFIGYIVGGRSARARLNCRGCALCGKENGADCSRVLVCFF